MRLYAVDYLYVYVYVLECHFVSRIIQVNVYIYIQNTIKQINSNTKQKWIILYDTIWADYYPNAKHVFFVHEHKYFLSKLFEKEINTLG